MSTTNTSTTSKSNNNKKQKKRKRSTTPEYQQTPIPTSLRRLGLSIRHSIPIMHLDQVNDSNYEEAARFYAANYGEEKEVKVEYQVKLGDCYYYGYGVKQNYKKAFELYRLAAGVPTKYPLAQLKLADCYFLGKE